MIKKTNFALKFSKLFRTFCVHSDESPGGYLTFTIKSRFLLWFFFCRKFHWNGNNESKGFTELWMDNKKSRKFTYQMKLYKLIISIWKLSTKANGFNGKWNVSEITKDYIGPPDIKSNIRPVIRHIPQNETKTECLLRTRAIEIEKWNQEIWESHNKRFFDVSMRKIKLLHYVGHAKKIPNYFHCRKERLSLQQTNRKIPILCRLIKWANFTSISWIRTGDYIFITIFHGTWKMWNC